jgi:uncharacterized protein YbjT (DUF2867 family)
MRVILFGATGMVGQGVLRECLLDPEVNEVLAIVRSTTGQTSPKLREILHEDFSNFAPIAGQLSGFDACFFCLGISSAGLSEADYHRITHDFALAAAKTLVEVNPKMTFIFVSGAGTDSTEKGRSMWARVKGKTENALLRLPFERKYMFRPAFIQPLHGITSKTKLYRVFYAGLGPLYPLLKSVAPKYVTTTELVGRAMLNAVKHGAPKTVLENDDLNRLAAG